jgi:hypothetical protein
MSDLPEAVDKYFRDRGKDPSKLDDIPKTKQAFKALSKADLDAIDMLNKLGKAIEDDFKDGKHVKDGAESAVTSDEKVQTYLYAIH